MAESNHDNHSALISTNQNEHYSAALQVARQLNAEFESDKALNLRDEHVVPVVAAVTVAGAILAGIGALIAVSRRAEHQIAPPAEQKRVNHQPVAETTTSGAIVLRRDVYHTQLTIIS